MARMEPDTADATICFRERETDLMCPTLYNTTDIPYELWYCCFDHVDMDTVISLACVCVCFHGLMRIYIPELITRFKYTYKSLKNFYRYKPVWRYPKQKNLSKSVCDIAIYLNQYENGYRQSYDVRLLLDCVDDCIFGPDGFRGYWYLIDYKGNQMLVLRTTVPVVEFILGWLCNTITFKTDTDVVLGFTGDDSACYNVVTSLLVRVATADSLTHIEYFMNEFESALAFIGLDVMGETAHRRTKHIRDIAAAKFAKYTKLANGVK